jgi:hypothetical protein
VTHLRKMMLEELQARKITALVLDRGGLAEWEQTHGKKKAKFALTSTGLSWKDLTRVFRKWIFGWGNAASIPAGRRVNLTLSDGRRLMIGVYPLFIAVAN